MSVLASLALTKRAVPDNHHLLSVTFRGRGCQADNGVGGVKHSPYLAKRFDKTSLIFEATNTHQKLTKATCQRKPFGTCCRNVRAPSLVVTHSCWTEFTRPHNQSTDQPRSDVPSKISYLPLELTLKKLIHHRIWSKIRVWRRIQRILEDGRRINRSWELRRRQCSVA
jgi:hypothetical protein